MRTAIAALVVALTAIAFSAPASPAAPTEVNVRIEGKTETLFEGPILTEGHNVRAEGDGEAPPAGHRCDGLNNHAHPTPGPTPTAAGVDAMAILGEGFDGDWYAAPFEDYFITQWGPDRQSNAAAEYWGLVVNDVFTSIGGCQYQLGPGDEVLWAYDAFSNRPRLLLYPGDYSGGALRLTAEAQLGIPFAVEVDAWSGFHEGTPTNPPPRSTEAFAGAVVAPVVESAAGFEEINADSSATVTTGADGKASIIFASPGWHRIKATRIVAGKETVIRSNRLDVCVAATLGEGCGPSPVDDLARAPSPGEPEGEGPGPEGPGDGGSGSGGEMPVGEGPKIDSPTTGDEQPNRQGGPARPVPSSGPVAVALRGLDRSRLGDGLLGVSWRVRDGDAGIVRWRISAKALGRRAAPYVSRASGHTGTSATVRLPKGAAYRLRIVFTDALGHSTIFDLGRVQVPE